MSLQRAIITGAGQGTGRAVAHFLAAQGLTVTLVGRTEAKLRAVADEIGAEDGNAHPYVLDVTDDAGIAAFVQSLTGTTIDVLVHCAGDWLIQPFDTTGNEQLDHILDVNLRAPYILSRALLPNLRQSDNASILFIGSLAAVGSYPGITAYTAAKTGLRAFAASLAAELRPELIRVVTLSPSPTNTPMRWEASPDMDSAMLIEPETVAQVVWNMVSLPQGITFRDVVLESLRLRL
jgi:NAD(P)-dependent dehydrogenase (short-subunit alcohol dehydrogenase family)